MKTHLIQPSATDTPAVQIHLLGRSAYSSRDPVRMHALGIALQRQQGVHAIASDRRVDFDTWPGTLSYTPPGVEVFSESATGGEYLVLRYAAHEADAPGPSRRISQHGQRAALQMAQHLRLLLLSPRPDALAIEQAALRFMACQEGSACGADARPGAGYGRVLERIAAEFDRPLSIADLSAMVDQPLALSARVHTAHGHDAACLDHGDPAAGGPRHDARRRSAPHADRAGMRLQPPVAYGPCVSQTPGPDARPVPATSRRETNTRPLSCAPAGTRFTYGFIAGHTKCGLRGAPCFKQHSSGVPLPPQ